MRYNEKQFFQWKKKKKKKKKEWSKGKNYCIEYFVVIKFFNNDN